MGYKKITPYHHAKKHHQKQFCFNLARATSAQGKATGSAIPNAYRLVDYRYNHNRNYTITMNTKIYKRNILNLNKKDDNGNTLPDATEYRVRDVLEDCGVLYHEVFDGNKRKPYAYGATYKGITTIIYYKSWYADITSVIYNHKEATGKGLTVSIIDRYAELKLI